MKRSATTERRSQVRTGVAASNDWERVALARVARHVAQIDSRDGADREFGWESAALKPLRKGLQR
jgi:hypothetical protein